ncbi:hypothetical protein A2291_07185 [candidate division WOR-1 bacterium RIFOXYB2_FULL_42_35]|uniref:Flagellar assembly protein FliH/Type III secretion system HrpE domain-containing protein n=1 Tax=candidate division WOR-1 bacterium RIFOXYC2_FULL_41_25 TaxID=1802586 RepID=A0A1F4TKT9_UNCSA|nr:MAG: hypothetical protein A2247_04525 [candidate division WOR-1 bacterium RIFOXYA2_FULL_41_14]OGC22489.1 MAG: hypothetical protein A2291_07185 [candidate division WOR-1 bacterium RIFOXYB2_FULL_42_35]OGC33227.1 MAG: hypothetical protein A2462_07360 [candidate division WOR-1 bacterium RIFOXYC2_FULL_41_25]OGC43488.1 MAG: hypothetical protein A2548_00865 [candidate division WOR-1 bacterium RIFOXYD2_FULL_41_8]
MGLIKKDQIEETGTITIEKPTEVIINPEPKKVISASVSLDSPLPQVEDNIPKAKTEAQKIIEKARSQAEAVFREAKVTGQAEGKAEVSVRLKEALDTLNQAVKERKEIIKDSENEILRLALKVAEQIVKSEVSLHRDVCLNIVTEAIARVSDREQIIVRVNREDSEYLKRYKDRLAGMLDGVKSFSILEDSNIETGGCVIETNLGFVDAKISTKIKSIEEVLLKAAKEEPRPESAQEINNPNED